VKHSPQPHKISWVHQTIAVNFNWINYTGTHNFCDIKLICVSYVFFNSEVKCVTRIAFSTTVFVTEYSEMQF